MDGAKLKKKFVIVDTDCGVDDAEGFFLALSKQFRENVEILAITCVHGNTKIDNVVPNVLRVLQMNQTESIPVFRGAAKSLVHIESRAPEFHSDDGFGGIADTIPVDASKVQSESAISALIRLSKEYARNVSLIALGPLTNLGIALCIDPDFLSRFSDLIIMGGNIHGQGNSKTSMTAEFNFGQDPESANAVLTSSNRCSVTIVPWETCINHFLEFEWFNQLFARNSIKANMYRKLIDKSLNRRHQMKSSGYYSCDLYAMAVALDPSIAAEAIRKYCRVELNGCHTRGQMAIDWNGLGTNDQNVSLVTKLDMDVLKQRLARMFD